MSSRRKSYTVAEAVITSNPDLDPIVVRFDDQPGRPPQVFDFSEFADFPHLYRHIGAAFNQHCGALRRVTRNGQFRCLRRFFVFLREHRAGGVKIDDASDLRTELLQAYAASLQHGNLTIRAQAFYYGGAIRVLRELPRMRPALFGHLVVPRRQFPGVGLERASRYTRKLDRRTLERLREAAWTDVHAIWSDFCRGQALLAEASERVDREHRPPNPRDLGELLVVIEREFAGVLPLFHTGHNQHLEEIVKHHGGTDVVARYLYATPETLAPFFILIGADTFANADALLHFRRDCVRHDPLIDGSYLVRWQKARSAGEQQRQLSGSAPSSVPRLVERLLALTGRLVQHAPDDESERLFLCRRRKTRHLAGIVGSNALREAFRRMIARWDVRGPDGRLLRFHLRLLRSTGLTLLYRQRHDLIGVSRAAGHSSLGVTVRYVLDAETALDNDQLIAHRQTDLARAVASHAPNPTHTPDEIPPPSPTTGFNCADPLTGRSPRARPGELCPEWLWPLTDPGLVIPNDSRYVARILQLQRHLQQARHQMRADRFNLVYLPLLDLIADEILPRFSDTDVLQNAHLLVDALAPLPDLVTA